MNIEFKYDVNTEVYVVKQFASGIIKIARDVITQCLYDGKKLYYLEKNRVTEEEGNVINVINVIAVDDKEELYKKIGELLDGTSGEDKGNNWRE